jgi:hypothetical protein
MNIRNILCSVYISIIFVALFQMGCSGDPTVRVVIHYVGKGTLNVSYFEPKEGAEWQGNGIGVGKMEPNTIEIFTVPRNSHLFAGNYGDGNNLWEKYANNNSYWKIPPPRGGEKIMPTQTYTEILPPKGGEKIMVTQTYSNIGAAIRAKNPDKYKNYSDYKIGKRAAELYPKKFAGAIDE